MGLPFEGGAVKFVRAKIIPCAPDFIAIPGISKPQTSVGPRLELAIARKSIC